METWFDGSDNSKTEHAIVVNTILLIFIIKCRECAHVWMEFLISPYPFSDTPAHTSYYSGMVGDQASTQSSINAKGSHPRTWRAYLQAV